MADEKMNAVIKRGARELRKPEDLPTKECLFFRI